MRNRTSDLRIPRSDALPLSHRDSTVTEVYYDRIDISIYSPANSFLRRTRSSKSSVAMSIVLMKAKHVVMYGITSAFLSSLMIKLNLYRWPLVSCGWNEMKRINVIRLVNPLQPNITIHILHTVLCTLTKVLTGRICLTIKSFFSWWSFPLLSGHSCVFQWWYCVEKLDASHS